MTKIIYPPTHTVDQVDELHGVRVADPYRWLEDGDSAETQEWIAAQNALTFDFLEELPARAPIGKRLTEIWDYPRASAPVKRGGRYFQGRNSGLQNQNVLYVMDEVVSQAESKGKSEARLLLDPNTLSTDGTVALDSWSVSEDGNWLAYATSASGSDWQNWRIRDVRTGQDLPDLIEWSKFSGAAWRKDGSGFYYGRYDAPEAGKDYSDVNYYHKLFFHKLGESHDQDQLVYERPDQKEWGFGGDVSEDGRYLIISVWQGTDVRNRIFYQDLQSAGPVVELLSELEAAYNFVGNDGPVFYFTTDLDAPRSRLIAIDTTRPEKEHWRTLISEGADTLKMVVMVHDEFIALYLHDAYHQLKRFDREGRLLGEIALPTLGSVVNLTGQRSDSEMFYAFCSFLYPVTVFRYDFQRGESELVYAPPLNVDTGPYMTRQVFATSRDGTRIPMFLTHRRDLPLDAQNPTLLYGYGGFNVALTPAFSASYLVWLEMGGVVAWANLRGGSEYGEEWHKAGMLENKQNVFDDFIACAEYLIAEKITSTPKLAIRGGSNGGLLVGACLNQRPDLFGAAVAEVGVMDMLRFHKFTIGWAWVSDFGSPDEPEEFQTLYRYSPLHNIKARTHYPATLIVTGDHDDRVVPGHSFKYAAALQAAQAGDAPILIRIQTKAGHGFGKPTMVLIQESADVLAFLTAALRIGYDGSGNG